MFRRLPVARPDRWKHRLCCRCFSHEDSWRKQIHKRSTIFIPTRTLCTTHVSVVPSFLTVLATHYTFSWKSAVMRDISYSFQLSAQPYLKPTFYLNQCETLKLQTCVYSHKTFHFFSFTYCRRIKLPLQFVVWNRMNELTVTRLDGFLFREYTLSYGLLCLIPSNTTLLQYRHKYQYEPQLLHINDGRTNIRLCQLSLAVPDR